MNIGKQKATKKNVSRWARQTGAHKAEIPAWFKLKNYEGLNKLGALQWYNLIALRAYLFSGCSDDEDSSSAIDAICADPLNEDHVPDEFYLGWHSCPLYHWLHPNGISLLSLSDLRAVLDWHEKSQAGTASRNVDLQAPTYIDNYLGEAAQLMYIDLNCTDAALMEQFAQTLSELRKVIKRPRLVESVSPPYDSWIHHGVLPFLDLKLWGRAHDRWFPNPRLARAIYADQQRGDSSIRNTTEVHADTLLDSASTVFIGLSIEARREMSFTNIASVNINEEYDLEDLANR